MPASHSNGPPTCTCGVLRVFIVPWPHPWRLLKEIKNRFKERPFLRSLCFWDRKLTKLGQNQSCKFFSLLDQVSFQSNVVSIKCCFDQMSFRSSVVSINCCFDYVSFRLNVVSIKFCSDQISFQPSVVRSSVVRPSVVLPSVVRSYVVRSTVESRIQGKANYCIKKLYL